MAVATAADIDVKVVVVMTGQGAHDTGGHGVMRMRVIVISRRSMRRRTKLAASVLGIRRLAQHRIM